MFIIHGYKIECNDSLKKELLEDSLQGYKVNWNMFNQNDPYYDSNSKPHHVRQVDHKLKAITLK